MERTPTILEITTANKGIRNHILPNLIKGEYHTLRISVKGHNDDDLVERALLTAQILSTHQYDMFHVMFKGISVNGTYSHQVIFIVSVLKQLKDNRVPRGFKMSGFAASHDCLAFLFNELCMYPQIESLDIGKGTVIDKEGAFVNFLDKSPQLKNLNFCPLNYPESLRNIMTALTKMPQLSSLTLNTRFTYDSLAQITCEFLPSLSNLHTLDIYCFNLSAESLYLLADYIKDTKTLQILKVQELWLGCDCEQEYTKAVAANISLSKYIVKSLNMKQCVRHVSYVIEHTTSLTYIYFSCSSEQLHSSSFLKQQIIDVALPKNTTLEFLGWKNMLNSDFRKIFNLLSRNTSLFSKLSSHIDILNFNTNEIKEIS